MTLRRYFSLFMLPALLTGCVHSGCSPDACKRPDSSDRDLVIWWPLEMRQGLDERDHQIDFTVVPLRD